MSRKITRFDKNKRQPRHKTDRCSTENHRDKFIRAKKCISILIVSDDTGNAEMICRILARLKTYDANIATVKSVDEARATTPHINFEILFLDDGLASADAFSLVRDMANATPSCAPILLESEAKLDLPSHHQPAPNGQTPLPNTIAGIIHILSKQGLTSNSLETSIRDALAAARRRDALMAQLENIQASRHSEFDQFLPWMRALLNDVNKIHGGASLALNGLADYQDEDPKALLSSTVTVSDRLRSSMLDTIQRLEAGQRRHSADAEDVDITHLLEQVVRDYRLDAEERGQILNYRRPDLPIPLAANAQAVRDVFRIILRNTIRNTAENTRIDIALSIQFGEVCISVCDTSPDGHWTAVQHTDPFTQSYVAPNLREKAGSIILINELMQECNGSIDVVTSHNASNELRCFFPRRGVA